MNSISFRAMGCAVEAFVDTDTPDVRDALAQVPAWFERWEQCFSRFRADSELMRLNRRRVPRAFISPLFATVMDEALRVALWSNGLVSPTLLPHMLDAGYDRSFDQLPSATTASRIVTDQPADSWKLIELDLEHHTLSASQAVQFDLGGIAKSWAAREAMRKLSVFGPALVNAGGDIACSTSLRNGDPWAVAVHNPCRDAVPLMTLAIGEAGVATSGRDFRTWTRNGIVQHHIIDPRTGVPANTDLLTATVIARDAVMADAAAKVLMILGSRDAAAWLQANPAFEAVLVRTNGSVVRSPHVDEFIWSEVPA